MNNSPIDDDPTPSKLEAKFGEEADLYAEVRAEAAAAAGNRAESARWQQLAQRVEGEEEKAGDRE